ncbi:hypothetical protein HispidOSU_001060, partial [Sigmodon hispidus]
CILLEESYLPRTVTQHITHISIPEHLINGFKESCFFRKEYWAGDVAFGVRG